MYKKIIPINTLVLHDTLVDNLCNQAIKHIHTIHEQDSQIALNRIIDFLGYKLKNKNIALVSAQEKLENIIVFLNTAQYPITSSTYTEGENINIDLIIKAAGYIEDNDMYNSLEFVELQDIGEKLFNTINFIELNQNGYTYGMAQGLVDRLLEFMIKDNPFKEVAANIIIRAKEQFFYNDIFFHITEMALRQYMYSYGVN